MGDPHPQGHLDGGELEEDSPPLLGADGLQLHRAHLQQLVPRQHPQAPHRAADGQTVRGERGLAPPSGAVGVGGLKGPPTSVRSPCPSARLSPPPARSWGAGWGGCPGAGDKGRGQRGGPLPPPPGGGVQGGEGRRDTHLAGTVPPTVPVLQGLQDVAGDVALLPPAVLHQPPLLLLVQDLRCVVTRRGRGSTLLSPPSRTPSRQGGGPCSLLPRSTHGGDPLVSTCSVSPILTLSSCGFLP